MSAVLKFNLRAMRRRHTSGGFARLHACDMPQTSGSKVSEEQNVKLDPDQLRQILAALYEVMRSDSGYGEVQIHINKGRPMFITRCFNDRLLPRRLRHDDAD